MVLKDILHYLSMTVLSEAVNYMHENDKTLRFEKQENEKNGEWKVRLNIRVVLT